MCNAFSAIVLESGDIYWQAGIDSHEDIIDKFKLGKIDEEFGNLHRIEITPDDGYLHPEGKWTFRHDEEKPKWWNNKYKDLCFAELEKWKEQIYSLINLEEARNPVNPFDIKPPRKITNKHIDLLKQWNSVKDSVWNSVKDSVGAYIGSLFKFPQWKKSYPYQSGVDLWKMGLVLSFDGAVWRLHGGKDGKILWEGKL